MQKKKDRCKMVLWIPPCTDPSYLCLSSPYFIRPQPLVVTVLFLVRGALLSVRVVEDPPFFA
jgi:hypothetical protein